MSTRKRVIHGKKRHNYKNYGKIRRQIELHNEFLYNETLKLELKQAKREDSFSVESGKNLVGRITLVKVCYETGSSNENCS